MVKTNLVKCNRDNIQIARDILEVAGEGSRKTRIMYGANLSYKLLSKYLASLTQAGLLTINEDLLYALTDEGRSFLVLYEKYESGKRKIGESINNLTESRQRLEKILIR